MTLFTKHIPASSYEDEKHRDGILAKYGTPQKISVVCSNQRDIRFVGWEIAMSTVKSDSMFGTLPGNTTHITFWLHLTEAGNMVLHTVYRTTGRDVEECEEGTVITPKDSGDWKSLYEVLREEDGGEQPSLKLSRLAKDIWDQVTCKGSIFEKFRFAAAE